MEYGCLRQPFLCALKPFYTPDRATFKTYFRPKTNGLISYTDSSERVFKTVPVDKYFFIKRVDNIL